MGDTRPVDARVAVLAAAQHGVVALRQLRTIGLGTGAINHRVRCGRLHRLHRGVFAVGHDRLSRQGRWMAAVLAMGDGAALSHVSAAALWGIRSSAANRIHVTVPTTAGRKHRDAIVLHRSRTLHAVDVEHVDGIAVTSIARTLLDVAGMLAAGPVERAVERSLELRLFDMRELRALIDADPTRPGARMLDRIVATMHDEPVLTRSEREAFMRDLCDARGLRRPEVNSRIDGSEVDFFWRAQRLIVETDGHETHGTRTAFERDRARDARLTVLGYRVVRFTHRQLVYERERVAATLVGLLAASLRAAR
jgi:very-short-patch-repair endonuclease